jgi:hypothetical protein
MAALEKLQDELKKFKDWNTKNPATSEIAIGRRNGYMQGIEHAIETIKEDSKNG